jgi:hypothetical protein
MTNSETSSVASLRPVIIDRQYLNRHFRDIHELNVKDYRSFIKILNALRVLMLQSPDKFSSSINDSSPI